MTGVQSTYLSTTFFCLRGVLKCTPLPVSTLNGVACSWASNLQFLHAPSQSAQAEEFMHLNILHADITRSLCCCTSSKKARSYCWSKKLVAIWRLVLVSNPGILEAVLWICDLGTEFFQMHIQITHGWLHMHTVQSLRTFVLLLCFYTRYHGVFLKVMKKWIFTSPA